MKRFLKQIALFTLLIVLVGVVSSIVFSMNTAAKYKLDPEVENVFIGDSHLQLAVTDAVKKSVNMASSGEAYYFTIYKLQRLLDANPQIHSVYLGFSYHNLSSYYDEFINGDIAKTVTPKYFWSLPNDKKWEVLQWNRKSLFIFAQKTMKESLVMLKKPSFPFFGYYNPGKKFKAVKKSMDKRLRFQYYKNDTLLGFSEKNIGNLLDVVELCKSRKIDLTVVNTPMHTYYRNQVPTKFVERYNEIISENQLQLVDLSQINLTDSCYIPDGDHVSDKGARLLVPVFDKLVTEN